MVLKSRRLSSWVFMLILRLVFKKSELIVSLHDYNIRVAPARPAG